MQQHQQGIIVVVAKVVAECDGGGEVEGVSDGFDIQMDSSIY